MFDAIKDLFGGAVGDQIEGAQQQAEDVQQTVQDAVSDPAQAVQDHVAEKVDEFNPFGGEGGSG